MGERYSIFIATIVLGSSGLWLMLPYGRLHSRVLGALLASAAFVLGILQMPSVSNSLLTNMLFWVLAGTAVVAAAAAITFRNPLYSAVWVGLSLLGISGLFVFLDAQFLAVAVVVVYVGAILVTFLFMLMLAQPEGKAPYDRRSWEPLVSATIGICIVAILSMAVGQALTAVNRNTFAFNTNSQQKCDTLLEHSQEKPAENKPTSSPTTHNIARLGAELYGKHLLAVQVAGLLLLVALVGAAAIVGHKKEQEIGNTVDE